MEISARIWSLQLSGVVLILAIVMSQSGLTAALAGADGDDCATRSKAMHQLFAMQTQLVYGNRSGGADNTIVFQLDNPAIRVDAQCAGHGPALTPGTNYSNAKAWYSCFIESRDPRISARFQFDVETSRVSIEQTWECDSTNSSLPYVLPQLCIPKVF